mgnify:CR=1 FL=1|jgi:hypothetical protein
MIQEKDERATALLNQIIEKAQEDDVRYRRENIGKKGSTTVGDGWYVFHLKLLRNLLNESNESNGGNQ